MTYKQWWSLSYAEQDHTWLNRVREIQKSLRYNSDPNAIVIHHLRDTEEQRKYNDEHYELWGHNLDGSFEYGKYVIFVTKSEHRLLHKHSDETKKKISENNARNMLGKHHSDETKKRISNSRKGKCSGENHFNYGKKFSSEFRKKLSDAHKGKPSSFTGKHHTDEAKRRDGAASRARLAVVSEAYHIYKDNGGELNWQLFQRLYKEMNGHVT